MLEVGNPTPVMMGNAAGGFHGGWRTSRPTRATRLPWLLTVVFVLAANVQPMMARAQTVSVSISPVSLTTATNATEVFTATVSGTDLGGTSHAWSNRSDKPCKVAFILIDAKPVP